MTVSLKEVKIFLRVDHNDDDSLIRSYIYAAEALCLDILRTEDKTILKSAKNAKRAVLYAIAYFYEHREEADYKALTISLRALLSGNGDITVYINSPGGDCVAAAQIYNMLSEYRKPYEQLE